LLRRRDVANVIKEKEVEKPQKEEVKKDVKRKSNKSKK